MSQSIMSGQDDSPSLSNEKHIAVVDAARGFCALYVFLAHLEGVYHLRQLFPEWRYLIAMFTDYAHPAVMAFFLLSGFSIHYSSLSRPLETKAGLSRYYFLRIRRIYPIFLWAVVLTVTLSALGCALRIGEYCTHLTSLSPGYLLQVLFFATDRSYILGVIAPVLSGNSPLWSLSYEVVYYLMYPLYWIVCRRLGNPVGLLLGFMISIAAIIPIKLGYPNHVSNVLSLYCLWCLGAWVGGRRRERCGITWPAWAHFLGCYILAQAVWVLEFSGIGVFYEWLWGALCFFLMMAFLLVKDVRHSTPAQKLAIWGGIAFGLIVILWASTKIHLAPDMKFFYGKIAAITLLFCVLIAVAKRHTPTQALKGLLGPFAFFGALSYALYVVHFPIIQFIKATEAANWIPSYGGLIIAPIISFVLAYLLEKAWQPIFNRWMNRLWEGASVSRRNCPAVDV